MRTEKITISFSLDKLQAIQVCSPEAYDRIEKQLQDTIEKIYVRAVPPTVRKYIESVMNLETMPKNNKEQNAENQSENQSKNRPKESGNSSELF